MVFYKAIMAYNTGMYLLWFCVNLFGTAFGAGLIDLVIMLGFIGSGDPIGAEFPIL